MGITIRRARKMARGMFRVGSTTSSLHWAMTSYPWKAMKVSPIALKTAPSPFGRNGWKLPCHSGMPRIAQAPAATKNRMIRTFAIVTKFPAFPVSDAPRMLMLAKTTEAATESFFLLESDGRTRQETVGVRKRALHPKVAAPRVVEARSELRVGHRGEQRHDAVQAEGEEEAGTRPRGGDSGEDGDAGSEHRPDGDDRHAGAG